MEASSKSLTNRNCTTDGDWTIILPRHGRQRRKDTGVEKISEEKQEPWAPTDSQKDPIRETTLMQKMEIYVSKIENSQFYQTFRDQIETSILDYFHIVLGSETSMKMVIYGIDNIELYEPPRLQLGIAMLMKRDLNLIGNVEVFDLVLSVTESRVLEALSCSVISINEHGKREAVKPTMFFMPCCEVELYNNLLQANWKPDFLNNIVLFRNSFSNLQPVISLCNSITKLGTNRH